MNQFDQDQQVPQLLPISNSSKKQQSKPYININQQQNNKINSSLINNNVHSQLNNKQSPNKIINNLIKIHTPVNKKQLQNKKQQSMRQLQKKFENKDKSPHKRNNIYKKDQETQKSKALIAAMINKISHNNLTQEKYPATNQVIDSLIKGIQVQIIQLQAQKQKKLVSNSNDLHAKKEKQQIQRSIDRCKTIKLLYLQKIELSNAIKQLQSKNIQLRAQNRDLKIKVTRGIQTIQNHMHNLPCQRQKQLKQQLNQCINKYQRQKFMRQNLQKNANDIVMNFNRLYQQANTARLIVVKRLKQIQQKQKALKNNNYNPQKANKSNESDSFQFKSIDSQIKQKFQKKMLHTSFPLNLEDIRKSNNKSKNSSNRQHYPNESMRVNDLNNQQLRKISGGSNQQGISRKLYDQYYKGSNSRTPTKNKPVQNKSPYMNNTIDDQMKKMKGNQSNVSRTIKRL